MAGDIFYNKVSLLLPMTGSNGSATFTDYSSSPKTVTPNGNAQISSAQTLFSENTGLFDGTGDYLSIPDNALWDVAGDYTVEFFCRLDAASGVSFTKGLIGTNTLSGSAGWVVGHYQDNLHVRINSTNYTSAGSFGIGVWHYVALVWSGSSFTVLLNGTAIYSGAAATTTTSSSLIIGNVSPVDANRYSQGHFANVRITKGGARDCSVIPTTLFPTYLEPRALELFAVNQPIVQAFNPTIFNG